MESNEEDVRIFKESCVVGGGKSEAFDVEQGVAQGCSLSPILFSVFAPHPPPPYPRFCTHLCLCSYPLVIFTPQLPVLKSTEFPCKEEVCLACSVEGALRQCGGPAA